MGFLCCKALQELSTERGTRHRSNTAVTLLLTSDRLPNVSEASGAPFLFNRDGDARACRCMTQLRSQTYPSSPFPAPHGHTHGPESFSDSSGTQAPFYKSTWRSWRLLVSVGSLLGRGQQWQQGRGEVTYPGLGGQGRRGQGRCYPGYGWWALPVPSGRVTHLSLSRREGGAGRVVGGPTFSTVSSVLCKLLACPRSHPPGTVSWEAGTGQRAISAPGDSHSPRW